MTTQPRNSDPSVQRPRLPDLSPRERGCPVCDRYIEPSDNLNSHPSLHRALIVGSTGIVGNNLADQLLAKGWSVAGLARKAVAHPSGLRPMVANLLKPDALATTLAGEQFTHVFFSTWMRHDTEAENIRVNAAMVRNRIDAVHPS